MSPHNLQRFSSRIIDEYRVFVLPLSGFTFTCYNTSDNNVHSSNALQYFNVRLIISNTTNIRQKQRRCKFF